MQSRTSWNGSTKKRLEEEDVTRDERKLRAELEWIRSRYDSAQVSDAVFAVVKKLETELSWRQHAQQEGTRHG